jgi:hypothetical protein
LLALAFLLLHSPFLRTASAQNLPVVGVWSSQYSNWNITDPTLAVGATFPVQINATNVDSINGYELVLYFDDNYIQVLSFDLKGGPNGLFPSPFAAVEFNGNASLRLSVVNTGQTLISGSGTLVSITFKVVKIGVSPLTLAAPMANPSDHALPPDIVCRNCPPGTPNWTRLVAPNYVSFDVQTQDGSFSNVPLSATHRAGPISSFTFSPSRPTQGETVVFDASASVDPDNRTTNNPGISKYIWDFGDRSNQAYVTVYSPIITHRFAPGGSASLNSTDFLGNFSIRLTVIDRDSGFQGMKTTLLTMLPPASHCVAVTTRFYSKDRVNPGQNITVNVQTKNTGTFQETFNLTVTYGPPNATLPKVTGTTLDIGKSIQWPFSFSTTNFKYGIYNLVATVTLYGRGNCRDGVNLVQFSIDQPNPPGQVLLLVGGIIAVPVSLGIASYFIGAFRKKRRLESEAL